MLLGQRQRRLRLQHLALQCKQLDLELIFQARIGRPGFGEAGIGGHHLQLVARVRGQRMRMPSVTEPP